jgi:hypothetical protein
VVSFTLPPLYSQRSVSDTLWIGSWVGSRAGLDDLEKRTFLPLPGLELRPLGRPVRSQSLYRLSYLGLLYRYIDTFFIVGLEVLTAVTMRTTSGMWRRAVG